MSTFAFRVLLCHCLFCLPHRSEQWLFPFVPCVPREVKEIWEGTFF